jgi:hypothetical protein
MTEYSMYTAVCFCGSKYQWNAKDDESALETAKDKFKQGLFYVERSGAESKLIWVNPNAPPAIILEVETKIKLI